MMMRDKQMFKVVKLWSLSCYSVPPETPFYIPLISHYHLPSIEIYRKIVLLIIAFKQFRFIIILLYILDVNYAILTLYYKATNIFLQKFIHAINYNIILVPITREIVIYIQ